MSQCAPSKEGNTYTCFDDDSLIKIAKSYNKKHPKDKIKYDRHKIHRKVLWEQIKEKMMKFTPGCDKESCLLRNPIVAKIKDSKIHDQTLRPKIPDEWEGSLTEWLSTLDIQAVMEQYEVKYPDFRFIGPVPIDFDEEIIPDMCVSDELCNIDLSKLYKQGVRKLGIVFNLDPHYRGGSHWVCMYVDFKTCGIYYFDSVGMLPPKEIKKLIDKIKHQGNNLVEKKLIRFRDIDDLHREEIEYTKISDKKIKIHHSGDSSKFIDNILFFGKSINRVVNAQGDILYLKHPVRKERGTFISKGLKSFYNNKQFQFKDSECGVYTIHFIEEFLKGKKFNELISEKHTDTQMMEKRKTYFRMD